MTDIVRRLRGLANPAAECLSDYQRINAFIRITHEAADAIEAKDAEIERLRATINDNPFNPTPEIMIARLNALGFTVVGPTNHHNKTESDLR